MTEERGGRGGPGDRERGTAIVGALPLIAGLIALGLAMAAGGSGDLLVLIATPPPIVRAALAAVMVVAGAWLLVRAIGQIGAVAEAKPREPGEISSGELRAMVRAVRGVFLAAAAFSAGSGWLIGHPLPIIVALVIAGVDVVETSLLLVLAGIRGSREG
jgi:hypothetical protein